jgi:hypothetical protein
MVCYAGEQFHVALLLRDGTMCGAQSKHNFLLHRKINLAWHDGEKEYCVRLRLWRAFDYALEAFEPFFA